MQGFQGQAIGNAVGQTAPRPTTFATIAEDLDGEILHAAELLSRVRKVADAIHGGEPRPVATDSRAQPESGVALHRLADRRARLNTLLGELHQEVSRLESAL